MTSIAKASQRLYNAIHASAKARMSTSDIQHEYAHAGYAFFDAYRETRVPYADRDAEYERISRQARHDAESELVTGGYIEVVEPPGGARYGRYWLILREW